MRKFSLVLLITLALVASAETTKITAREARNHIGEHATVCGQVASTKFAYRSKGAPTFINLDQPYPDQIFTAVIWVEDRPKFGEPEVTYTGKRICVSGDISSYRGIPEIVVRGPNQLTMFK